MAGVAQIRRSMRLRGRSYMAFALTPEPPIADWLSELDAWMRGSAGFFAGRPVVVDLSTVTLSGPAVAHLIHELEVRQISILGIEGVDAAALGPDLPPLLNGGRDTAAPEGAGRAPAKRAEPASLLIAEPVRSGQSIVFPEGDVTVIGSVASGAEIVAGGSIHIYGALRGRAMAGTNGNPRARIFSRKVEAELLAIDGYYRTAEDMDARLRGRPAQAWLDGNVLMMAALD